MPTSISLTERVAIAIRDRLEDAPKLELVVDDRPEEIAGELGRPNGHTYCTCEKPMPSVRSVWICHAHGRFQTVRRSNGAVYWHRCRGHRNPPLWGFVCAACEKLRQLPR